MKLGANPKQMGILASLVALAVVLQFMGSDDPPRSTGPRPTPSPAASPKQSVIQQTAAKDSRMTRPSSNRKSLQEYKPVLKSRRVEDRVDPTTIDPTLRLDLISRLANLQIQGGTRSLFEFGTAPPPKAPDPGKIIPANPSPPKPVVPVGPAPAPVASKPTAPKAPPIPLRFYGFTSARAGAKRAFFIENEDVYVATEGDIVKKRYKLVRINLSSAVMEDIEFKQEQTLPLVEITQ